MRMKIWREKPKELSQVTLRYRELWEKISDLNSILTKFKRALHKAVFGK